MKRITFLTVTLVTPFITHSMDGPKYVTPEAIIIHKKDVVKLRLTTYTMLQNFQSDEKKSAYRLIKVIEQTNCLKQACITERELGFLLFNQKPSFGSSIFSNSTIDHFHASVFFERLGKYNQNLAQQVHISPNKAQLNLHWKNQHLHKIAAKSTAFGITIPESTLTEKVIPTLPAVDVAAFDALMLHIGKMIQEDSKIMKKTAKLIYHNELKNQPAPISPENFQNLEDTH